MDKGLESRLFCVDDAAADDHDRDEIENMWHVIWMCHNVSMQMSRRLLWQTWCQVDVIPRDLIDCGMGVTKSLPSLARH